MDEDRVMRFDCLQLAVNNNPAAECAAKVVETAQTYYDFVAASTAIDAKPVSLNPMPAIPVPGE